MTKDEFTSLQLQYHQSGKSLKAFLKDSGICYSNYHYWDKKYKFADTPQELAPIMFMDTRQNESESPVAGRFRLPEYNAESRTYSMEWRDLVLMVEGIKEDPEQRLRRLKAEQIRLSPKSFS